MRSNTRATPLGHLRYNGKRKMRMTDVSHEQQKYQRGEPDPGLTSTRSFQLLEPSTEEEKSLLRQPEADLTG